MKLLSEYVSEDFKKEAKVYYVNEKTFTVSVKSDMGITYTASFNRMQLAEDFAENWVIGDTDD